MGLQYFLSSLAMIFLQLQYFKKKCVTNQKNYIFISIITMKELQNFSYNHNWKQVLQDGIIQRKQDFDVFLRSFHPYFYKQQIVLISYKIRR